MHHKNKIRTGILAGLTVLFLGGMQGCATPQFTKESKTYKQETIELDDCNRAYARNFFRENEYVVPDNTYEAIEKAYSKVKSKKIAYGSKGCYIKGKDFSRDLFKKTLSKKLKNKSSSEIENIIELLKEGNILIKDCVVRNFAWEGTLRHERAHKIMYETFTEEENKALEEYAPVFVSYLKERANYGQLVETAKLGYQELFAECTNEKEMIVELAGAKAPQSIINLYGRLVTESKVR